jgi:leucyl aminopeptidase
MYPIKYKEESILEIIDTDKNILKLKTNTLVIGVFKNEKYSGALRDVNSELGGVLKSISKDQGFDGSEGDSVTVNATYGKIGASRVMLVGLGPKSDYTRSTVKKAAILTAGELRGHTEEITFSSEFSRIQGGIAALIEGLLEGSYDFDKYKTEVKPKKKFKIIQLVSKRLKESTLKDEVRFAKVISDSTKVARDLVNEPPLYVTPAKLANVALEISADTGLGCEIFDRTQIEKRGMGGIEAVSRGSDVPPKFIHLTYEPKKYKNGRKPKKTIAIVGKGITFDSGGLCLKPADSMRGMKMDMAGAAVVLGVMKALPELLPSVRVHGLIPASENMTGAKAYKPDDVIRAYNGKTIEVINTDAEGRIVLSDALSYAVELGVDEIVDLATLTGACMVGLGSFTAGVMGNDQKLAQRILRASEKAGEKMWQLPMDDELRDELKSSVADIKNAGSRLGGAITAAMFLEQFVSNVPWVHIDIAGPAYSEKSSSLRKVGGTGFGVGTIVEYILGR